MTTQQKLAILSKKTFIDDQGHVQIVSRDVIEVAAKLDEPHLSPDGLLLRALNAEPVQPVRV